MFEKCTLSHLLASHLFGGLGLTLNVKQSKQNSFSGNSFVRIDPILFSTPAVGLEEDVALAVRGQRLRVEGLLPVHFEAVALGQGSGLVGPQRLCGHFVHPDLEADLLPQRAESPDTHMSSPNATL